MELPCEEIIKDTPNVLYDLAGRIPPVSLNRTNRVGSSCGATKR